MKEETRARNRRHLIKALALGLEISATPTAILIQSESNPQVHHRLTHSEAGRWFCGCQWSSDHDAGYDPRSDIFPCKHILLALWHRLDAATQARMCDADPALAAAVDSGTQIRRTRDTRADFQAAIVAEAMVYATRARLGRSDDPIADNTAAAYTAARQALRERGRAAVADLWG